MTVTHRKRQHQPDEIAGALDKSTTRSPPPPIPCNFSRLVTYVNELSAPSAVNEPGFQIECDGCYTDLTHSIRIKCADPICEPGDGVDICPTCFCGGKEFKKHKRGHAYRVVVSRLDSSWS